jgi:hypothetical protein
MPSRFGTGLELKYKIFKTIVIRALQKIGK